MSSALLKGFKDGQPVTLQHKTEPITIHGKVHNEYDDELGRIEVLDPNDNAIFMITPDDMFWEISAPAS
jgi:hypothetical protein